MKNLINKILILVLTSIGLVFSGLSVAVPSTGSGIVNIVNPAKSVNVQIGDVLHREVEIAVSKPGLINKNAFPVKGSNQNGVELVDVKVVSVKRDAKTIYKVNLSYQVFSYSAKPMVMQLPAEHIAVTGGSAASSIDIPAWHFWYSPMVPAGITNAKDNMQPQFRPTLIDLQTHTNRLIVLLIMLLIGLLGLVYINADKQWLPFMNGAFAQAHRKIKKLAKNQTGEQKALLHMHQAFNQTYGANLFPNDIPGFVAKHPPFAALEADIAQFFERSNAALFGYKAHSSEQLINEMIALSKALRTCERGIK